MPLPNRPLRELRKDNYFYTINYTTRTHLPSLARWNETISLRLVHIHEARVHGVDPCLYVAASGDHDHIVHLVDSHLISGNADDVMTHQLVVETMPSGDSAADTGMSTMDHDSSARHCRRRRVGRHGYALMNAVASYGASRDIGLRLGIVTDNRVPQLGGVHNNSHSPSAETH